MAARRVMRMDRAGVKKVLRSSLLRDKKMIGRGSFSLVFEGSRPDRVIRVTMDQYAYFLLNDSVAAVDHPSFPVVYDNFGEVGESHIIGPHRATIWAFETERLSKLTSSRVSLARSLWRASANSSARNDSDTYEACDELTECKYLPAFAREAFGQIRKFAKMVPGAYLDAHTGNFMERDSGEIVFNDPVCDGSLLINVRSWPL